MINTLRRKASPPIFYQSLLLLSHLRFMPTHPPHKSIVSDLDSSTITPPDSWRQQIPSRLHHIGNTILTVDLKKKRTILDFNHRYVTVLPHDYGCSVRRLPHNLHSCGGVTCWQRQCMDRIGVYYHDNLLLIGGAHPSPGCSQIDSCRV